jgi:hypothetical protein
VQVIHTAENSPDVTLPDSGAESVARFISTRTTPGSYHRIVDSDSVVEVVPFGWEAFHDGTGTNRHSIGLSVACHASQWGTAALGEAWETGALDNLARAAAEADGWLKTQGHSGTPARRVTGDDARRGVAGFVSHAELDPSRRTDPGARFPWDRFLDLYDTYRTGGTPNDGDEDMFTDEDRELLRRAVAHWENPVAPAPLEPNSPAWFFRRWNPLIDAGSGRTVAQQAFDLIGKAGAAAGEFVGEFTARSK